MSALLDVYPHLDLEPVEAEGVWLTAADGRRYLDFYGGHAVALLGYRHPALLEALGRQAHALFFQSNVVPLAVRERAAQALVDLAPPGLARVFFVNSGAEANENALRVALRVTGRPRVVAVEGAFHGRTSGAAAVTAGSERWNGFPRTPFDVTFVPFDDVAALRAAVDGSVAAVILEPVQGVAGARALSRGFVHAAREACTVAGARLIADEVQCGLGRTGYRTACEGLDVTPDLMTLAKGVAGGFPAGALLLTEADAATLKHGDLGTTFGGAPMAVALIEVVARHVADPVLLANVRRLSARLAAEAVVGPVTAVQGAGFLLGLRTTRPAKAVLADLRARSILAGGSADPHVVRLLPPLVLTDEHVDRLVAALEAISA